MGAGDLGVGRRVKTMAQALYGRIAAYEAVFANDEAAAAAAFRRNLFGTVAEPGPDAALLRAMIAYVRREEAALAATSAERLAAGALGFGPPPVRSGERTEWPENR